MKIKQLNQLSKHGENYRIRDRLQKGKKKGTAPSQITDLQQIIFNSPTTTNRTNTGIEISADGKTIIKSDGYKSHQYWN